MELEQKLIELIDRAEAAGTKLAPEALDALVRAAQIEAGFTLSFGALAVVIFIGCLAYGANHIGELIRLGASTKQEDMGLFATALIKMVIVAVAGIAMLGTSIQLLFVSANWLALIDPLAYVARQILMP